MSETIEYTEVVRRQPQVAFGRFVKSETHDVFGEYDTTTVTEDEQRWMTAERLGGILFGRYPRRDLGVVDGLRISTDEYNLVARDPQWLASTVMARVISDREVDDARIEKARGRAAEALDRKRDRMQEHLGLLVVRQEHVHELARQAKMPGFAHKTEERMTRLFGTALDEFQNMLEVAHLQRNWTDEKRYRAHTALLHHLTVGPQRQRVANWQNMLSLTDRYLSARQTLFRNRIRRTGEFLTSSALAA
jgi:hypothetical protein